MAQHSSPGHTVPQKHSARRRSPQHLASWFAASMVGLLGLGLFSPPCMAESAEQPGFDQDCSGFSEDIVLRSVQSERSRASQQHTSLVAMTPRVIAQGTALASYMPRQDPQAKLTLETMFGLVNQAQRKLAEATFYQESRGVVLSPQVLATVAHAVTADTVQVQVGEQDFIYTVPLSVTRMDIVARLAPGAQQVRAQVAHINEPYDLALVRSQAHEGLPVLPYPVALSYGTGDPAQPTGGLQAGDCVATLVPIRDEENRDTSMDRLVFGKVLARVPVAVNSLTQTKLNVNMFTTDLSAQPGDSGSPVLALKAGKPVLVGLISATMYPNATFTYVTRIDPILAQAHALGLVTASQSARTLAWHHTPERSQP